MKFIRGAILTEELSIMEKLNFRDKIYLDKAQKKQSEVNVFLKCRDGIIELYEYYDGCGYRSKTRLFLCEDTKHESMAVIRQTYSEYSNEWLEQVMYFDTDSFAYLKALINGKKDELGGEYFLIRDYTES